MVEEKKKKGLGRGLMSLFGDQSNEETSVSNKGTSYLSISISDLVRNQFQPRNYFDDKKIGEFFDPITLKPASKIGMIYKYPEI